MSGVLEIWSRELRLCVIFSYKNNDHYRFLFNAGNKMNGFSGQQMSVI